MAAEKAERAAAINGIWLAMVLAATVTGAWTGRMDQVTQASFDSAKAAVTLALGLVGPMALWLGVMRVAEAGGLMAMLARGMRPLMVRLFPDVPAEHPAMSAMLLNLAANTLGLGNAATPMGIKAMQELDRLSPEKGTATDAMCLFLAINTSSVTLLPLGVITVRAAAGCREPAAIIVPAILATLCSTAVAVVAGKVLARRRPAAAAVIPTEAETAASGPAPTAASSPAAGPGRLGRLLAILTVVALLAAALHHGLGPSSAGGLSLVNQVSAWCIPLLLAGFLLFGYLRGVPVYETLTEGAAEGFTTAVRIIPFMVAIFTAIGMLRASGAMELAITILDPVTSRVGMPAEALSMALLRPLSGSGAFGLMSEIVSREPDGFLAYLVSVMQGSTETTFYVLAVYFGAVGIRRSRHALAAALTADVAGMAAALFFSHLFF